MHHKFNDVYLTILLLCKHPCQIPAVTNYCQSKDFQTKLRSKNLKLSHFSQYPTKNWQNNKTPHMIKYTMWNSQDELPRKVNNNLITKAHLWCVPVMGHHTGFIACPQPNHIPMHLPLQFSHISKDLQSAQWAERRSFPNSWTGL